MAKHRIRITGAGIHGAPTKDNPTGEIAIGTEFETDADLPTGWVGRAVIVGEEPAEGSVFVTGNGEGGDLIEAARKEVIQKAEEQFDRMRDQHASEMRSIVARAEKAEGDLQKANEQIEALNLKIRELEKPAQGDATADEVKTAVGMLDASVAAHWTTTGLPAVDAVSEIVGKPVTRKAIEEAAPGVKRSS